VTFANLIIITHKSLSFQYNIKGFRVCRADAETDHKCHRGKPVGRGRWRRKEDETGDEGLSATGTNIH